MATIKGTKAADKLKGIIGEANEIWGNEGDDRILGRDGDDSLAGNAS